jgi:transcriptional regulator with XRE-family HTH domain
LTRRNAGVYTPAVTPLIVERNAIGRRIVKSKDPEKAREIGARITEARQAAGMKQRELADLLGVSERSIQAYEQGETVPWRFGAALEQALNRPSAWFWYGREAEGLSGSSENLLRVLLEEQRASFANLEAQLVELRDEVAALAVTATSTR